jgi:hypothetical protein
MSRIEERYRFVLRLLPASYRQRWEEDMVAAFLESVQSEDPEEAEFIAEYGRPSWSEVASVVALAVRLRLGTAAAPPRYLAWGRAVRLAVLAWVLVHAVSAIIGAGFHLWLFGRLPWLPVQVDDVVLYVRSDHWFTADTVAGFLWVPAYLALLVADRRVAKALVLLAAVTNSVMMIISAAHTGRFGAERLTSLVLVALLVLALAAFHRGSPPIAPRPWLIALPVGVAVNVGLLALIWPPQENKLQWLDWPAMCSVVIVGASIVHLSFERFRRAPSWSHALALLVGTVLILRVVWLLDYLDDGPFEGRATLITLGLLETGALLAVGVTLALLAARALRRLPPEPVGVAAWSSRSDRSTGPG